MDVVFSLAPFVGRYVMHIGWKSNDRLLSRKTKRILKNELEVIFILGFVFWGSLSFCLLIASLFPFIPNSFNWRLFAWIAAFITLPKSYVRFQRSNAPYAVKFIRAFSDGVTSPTQLIPTMSRLSGGILNLVRRISGS